jgi:hypothetical protein
VKMKSVYLCGAAATLAIAMVPANAATIILVDQGGVTGSAAQQGFNIAAGYWASILSNNVTIKLGVKYAALPPNVIGSTRSYSSDISVANWAQLVNQTKSNSAIDTGIVLPTLNAAGGASFVQNGTTPTTVNTSIAAQYLNTGNTVSSQILYENNAVIKAIGGTVIPTATNPLGLDGAIQFSSNFGFDFNPTDGIAANTFDFIGVAIHEIGHALGFVSGVDAYDYYGTNGPGAGGPGYDLNSTSIFSALDMFRYSNDPNNKAPGNGPVLDLTVGTASYFSLDGGNTQVFGNALFSTGAYNGDGRQASHWKDTAGCAIGFGIMDPTFCFGQEGFITGLDLAAFDAIGWNLNVAANPNYLRSTSQIYRAAIPAVPESGTWAMMIFGFGLVGATMRRRARVTTTVTYG